MKIWRQYTFEAAHFLPRVPPDHKCRRLHGHSYQVEVHVAGTPSEIGWIVDFADIDGAWSPLHVLFDHHLLNDVPGLDNPTCENLAEYIWDVIELPGLHRIVVRETARSGCEYEGPVRA